MNYQKVFLPVFLFSVLFSVSSCQHTSQKNKSAVSSATDPLTGAVQPGSVITTGTKEKHHLSSKTCEKHGEGGHSFHSEECKTCLHQKSCTGDYKGTCPHKGLTSSCSKTKKECHSHKTCKKCNRQKGEKDSHKKCSMCKKKWGGCKHFKSEGLASVSSLGEGSVKGTVTFMKSEEGIRVVAQISGLKPGKSHGFHIHQYGDCSQGGKNAGTHFNPYKHSHGGPHSKEKHLGDLGNLTANEKGEALYDQNFKGCIKKLIGRSVIIHEGADDFKTQPTGGAGAYIGCGVIGKKNPDSSQ